MFPIRDSRGRVLAFGGRIIDAGEPKYLNSPETMLFHKGRELYGLYEVRQSRTTLKRLMVVEGYMDVARLHQAGVNYAVATLGTATTPEHLRRIFKLVNEVVFCFDGDKAGRAAAWRALGNALPEARDGRQIRFLFLPEGHDPDSLVGDRGSRGFREAPRWRRCRCPNTWPRRSPSRPISAMPTGARSSPNWRGRWSPRWRRVSIETCSLIAYRSL